MFSMLWYFELVFVLTVIGVLVGLAVKPYASTLKITSAMSAVSVASFLKSEVYRFYVIHNRWPDSEDIVIDEYYRKELKDIREIRIDKGSIDIEFNNISGLKSQVLSFRKAEFKNVPGSTLIWLCGYQPVPNGMTVDKVNRTSINRSELPHICK